MAPKKDPAKTPIEALRHQDRRTNIPTHELAGFVAEDEKSPKAVLYPRDPSLDPQLVWKGKDAQDAAPLSVDSLPIYIQEKIQPRVILDEVRAQAAGERSGEQLDLFSDFNGIDLEKQVQFYQHEQNWTNRMILGDSLQVMTSLADKERLKGQVQMIYMDPPYGIKFGSNWQVSTRKRDVKDGKIEDLTRQPEQIRAFRDTWELGIHSYLAYLRDRLTVARELLTETGSVFVQIGDENVHLVRSLLDEVFGSENAAGFITFKKTSAVGSFGGGTNLLPATTDYIIWYLKDRDRSKYRSLFRSKEVMGSGGGAYRLIETPDLVRRSATRSELETEVVGGRFFRPSPLTSITVREAQTTVFPVEFTGKSYLPGGTRGWSTNKVGISRLKKANRLFSTGSSLNFVRYIDDFPAFPLTNFWDDTQSGSGMDKVYVVQTNVKVIERCILMATDPGDLVLDPTCGGGTTAYVAEQWGRRWITTDTSRVALALARTRLMSARYPYYLLSDSSDGITKESEITGTLLPPRNTALDVRKGFVYRRVPHVTLKAIANNPEIDEIHERWQKTLEPLQATLNRARKSNWQEWEIPREPGADWPAEAKRDLERWWQARRKRQEEIDASIARNSETELLVDQPYEDSKKIRVTGPFTVESLSPHRMLSPDQELPRSLQAAQTEPEAVGFVPMILENLRKAGIQNTRKGERLVLDTLDPWPGVWIHAAGTYTDKEGATRRVAVSIGPEHGTVGKEQIVDAAKEAVRGTGFDLLVVMGFAFDPHASQAAREVGPALDGFAVAEETRQFGRLPVLLARMNPDLAMGNELKKTGAGNLFMVFGEPDIRIHQVSGNGRSGSKARQVTVEIRGVDIFDPTTGEIRPSSTDEIACWFLDTDYNEESFFVRHAYFTGGDEPYDKLKRALRSEIDEAAWSALYSTTSRPFDVPKCGRIAVKVINHYGDEVLKVYTV